jgi:hypothetical protein
MGSCSIRNDGHRSVFVIQKPVLEIPVLVVRIFGPGSKGPGFESQSYPITVSTLCSLLLGTRFEARNCIS